MLPRLIGWGRVRTARPALPPQRPVVICSDYPNAKPAGALSKSISLSRCPAVPLSRCPAVPPSRCPAVPLSRCLAVQAMEMAMLGERLSAAKALEWGLVNQVSRTTRPSEQLRVSVCI